MATGDLYRTAIEYTISSQTNVNVMYMLQTGGSPLGNATNAAEDMAPLFAQMYGKVLSTSSRAEAIKVTCQKVDRFFSDSGEKLQNLVGSPGVVLTLPPANAVVMRLKTGLADRTRRGRFFIGGIPSDRTSQGVLSPSGQTLYEAFRVELQSGFVGSAPQSGFRLGVFSRKRYKINSNPFDDYWKPVTQLQIAGAIATMRSRKVGVGS